MMVMEFGYFAALEQHPPAKLLEHGVLAEKCGFDLIMGSDHSILGGTRGGKARSLGRG